MTTRLHLRFVSVVCTAAFAFACSSSDDNGSGSSGIGSGASSNGGDGSGNGGSSASTGSGGTTSGTGATGSGATGTGTGASTGSGGSISGTGGSVGSGGSISGSGGSISGSGGVSNTPACSGLPLSSSSDAGMSCAGVSFEAEAIDIDMYLMVDKTQSMTEEVGTTGKMRWDFVQEAVQKFVTDPAAANIGVGIQFFNQSGTSLNQDIDCDVSRYATPAVPIGLASDVGADVVAAMEAQRPLLGGFTPLLPAAQGAIQYARSWQPTHPGRATVVVLVTDGFPTECQSPVSVSEVASVIAEGYNNLPSIRTFIVGLPSGPNLPTLAIAGGTDSPFLIDEGDITTSFVNTLLNISNASLACEYEIPIPLDQTMQIDYTKVQVVYTPNVGDPEEIPHAQSYTDCSASAEGGWYYDNNTNPSKIQVCPCTCSRFQAGTVEVRLGCEPAPVQIR